MELPMNPFQIKFHGQGGGGEAYCEKGVTTPLVSVLRQEPFYPSRRESKSRLNVDQNLEIFSFAPFEMFATRLSSPLTILFFPSPLDYYRIFIEKFLCCYSIYVDMKFIPSVVDGRVFSATRIIRRISIISVI